MEIRTHKQESLKDALLLVGFPSRGLVGGVAVNYVVEQLKMWQIGSLYDPRLPPTVLLRGGIADSPIQFFASAQRCGPDGKCDKLIACLSEIPLDQATLGEAVMAILEWAKNGGVSHAVVLEGVESLSAPDDQPPKKRPAIRAVRSRTSRHNLGPYKVEELREGVLSSYASAFLLAANQVELDLVALFVEAAEDMPDAHAAAQLLKGVDRMLPHIDLRTEVLEARASELETSMKSSMDRSSRQLRGLQKAGGMMFQ